MKELLRRGTAMTVFRPGVGFENGHSVRDLIIAGIHSRYSHPEAIF